MIALPESEHLNPEERDSMFLQNVEIGLQDYTAAVYKIES
jgi:hypothetical protein